MAYVPHQFDVFVAVFQAAVPALASMMPHRMFVVCVLQAPAASPPSLPLPGGVVVSADVMTTLLLPPPEAGAGQHTGAVVSAVQNAIAELDGRQVNACGGGGGAFVVESYEEPLAARPRYGNGMPVDLSVCVCLWE